MHVIDLKIIDIEKKFADRRPGVVGDYRNYSIFVPLIKKDGKVNLLFEVRSPGLERQPGEVCFPGGRAEDGEEAGECALRETCEELGLQRVAIRMIARLDTIYTYNSLALYPFLGEINEKMFDADGINKKEVESVFYVPLADFVNCEPYSYKAEVRPDVRDDFPYEMIDCPEGYDWSRGIYEVLIYRFGDKAIWGITARIAHSLAMILKG